MKFGQLDVTMASDGTFKLDGGAMFGVVPKPIWQKYFPADERNRITLGTNVMVIRDDKNTALVDLGMGDKFDERLLDIYDIRREKTLIDDLGDKGIRREDVTHIIISHGHLDHTGWSTIYNHGILEPTFPNARYYFQEDTYEEIKKPNEKTRPNYNFLNFENLESKIELVNGDEEIFPGVELMKSGGHTKGHQVTLVRDGNSTFTYFGDLIPTSAHIKPAYVMAYDLYPLDTFSRKKELLQKAYDEQWLLFFEHDPAFPVGRLKDVERYSLEKITI